MSTESYAKLCLGLAKFCMTRLPKFAQPIKKGYVTIFRLNFKFRLKESEWDLDPL